MTPIPATDEIATEAPLAPPSSRPHPEVVRTLALLGLAAIPALLAVLQLGRIHPDEVFQALEPAWHRAFGYGVLAWEWREGLRNWAVPGLFSWLLRLGATLGVEHPQVFRAIIGVPLWALHFFALRAVFLYAQRRVATLEGAWLAAGLVALSAPVLLYAGRTLGEGISVGFLLIAVELLDRPAARGAAVVAGLMLGAAVITRYASGVLVLAALLWLLGARRFVVLALTCAGGAVMLAALAGLDWATWGKPLHSFLAYVDFNVLSGKAARQFGAEGPGYYLPLLLRSLPAWAYVGTAFLLRRERLPLPVWMGAAYLLAITLTPHKEERFLYPAWALLSLAGGAGMALLFERVRRGALRAGLATAALLFGLVPFAFAPELRGDQFRAIVRATRAPEVTGLLIVNEGLWGSGGYFHVGKNIPWGTCDWPRDVAFQRAMRDRRINRVVTFEGRALEELQAAGFRVTGVIGRETILER